MYVPNIAKVVVGLPVDGPFDYKVTEERRAYIQVGQRVKIMFNRRKMVGYIVGFAETSEFENVSPILTVLDKTPSLNAAALQLTKKLSEYYGCSWGEAIECYLPAVLRTPRLLAEQFPEEKPSSGNPVKNQLILDPGQQERWPLIIDQVRKSWQAGEGIIFLVPEVALLKDIEQKLKKEIPGIGLTVYERGLSTAEAVKQWVSVRLGKVTVVLGTRSAIFAPVRNLKTVIVYDEDNAAYKQEQSPHYHVNQIARWRKDISGGCLMLVSSLPSVESWHTARQEKWDITVCPSEHLAKVMPVDLTNFNPKVHSFLSFPLQNKINETLQQKGKVVMFINRSGYEVTMEETLGRFAKRVAKFFPQADIKTFFKETKNLSRDFDILIATQAIFRMREQLRVNMAAMINFDDELNRMDYRSSHKALAAMMHLRRLSTDAVVVQTFLADNHCLKTAKNLNLEEFYHDELELRRDMNLPPFEHMISVTLRGDDEKALEQYAQDLYQRLEDRLIKKAEVMAPHPLSVLRKKFRQNILLKGPEVEPILAVIKEALKDMKRKRKIVIVINVDP
ncbi:MAG: hypothetical protein KC684_03975 [Candidatus Omnitrophica bacterium]|nr:hypothetical protein [Candidatus Omnitrophota bacterium]